MTRNVLFILSDEHNPRVLGSAGHKLVRTPHLDRLAARGTRFTSAYCNAPICVPSRASFHTGQYVHRVRFWDNGQPYDGSVTSWAHRLRAAGRRAVSIGKLHFRASEDDNGLTEMLPLHVVEGVGDPIGWIRTDMPARKACLKLGEEAGPGESHYQDYDRRIADAAIDWLNSAGKERGQPWVLYVSFVLPHFPIVAAQRYYDLYPHDALPWPKQYDAAERPRHPWLEAMRRCLVYDDGFTPERVKRALAAYFGMVTALDENIGRVLAALEQAGLGDTTRVIYTSDHGDNLGARGMWGKSTMYEESAGVPMILAGPDVPRARVCATPVSLIDLHPTLLDAVGVESDDRGLPGRSLWTIAREADAERTVFSEYHAMGSMSGAFMVRRGRWKYVEYVGLPAQLFDLHDDPEELADRAGDPALAAIQAAMAAELRTICDPEAVDRAARADQARKIAEFGGREAILKRPSLAYSPVPGQKATYG